MGVSETGEGCYHPTFQQQYILFASQNRNNQAQRQMKTSLLDNEDKGIVAMKGFIQVLVLDALRRDIHNKG